MTRNQVRGQSAARRVVAALAALAAPQLAMAQEPPRATGAAPAISTRSTANDATAPDAAVLAQLEAIRAKAGLPALGVAIVTTEGVDEAWVTGVRAAGHKEKVELDDAWHLGSCTKSMTATLIALLVERGDLGWEMTLPELLPDLADAIHADYRDVTLPLLLSHRAGVPSDLSRDGLWGKCWEREGTAVEQRRRLAKTVLSWGPLHEPGTKFLYSNAGIAIAGHLAETVTGKPYEELMQELLFKPLGITTAGFGPPGGAGAIDQPRGHDGAGQPVEPGPAADNPPAIAPAGTCHMSLADWGRYLALHLRSAKGAVKVGDLTLRAETMQRLHTPFDGPGDAYAMGWGVAKRPWAGGDGIVWTHNGSNTMWYCVAWLAPSSGFALIATTNLVGSTGQQACDQAVQVALVERQRRAASAKSASR